MSIFLKCCKKDESKDSIDLNQSDESYSKSKPNLNSEKEEENQELVEKVLIPQVFILFIIYILIDCN